MRSYKIPYAVMNYAQLREEGYYYYVDKSRYIVELEKYQVPVFLRPRRFGKSLFCTMLDYYYDLNEADRFESLFGDTWIGQHPTGRQDGYGFDKSLLPEIRQIIRNNYDGYRFLPGAEPIYNSTILTYFLKRFTINNGTIPDELIDENLRTDLGWIKRLTLGEDRAKEMLHQLVYEGTLALETPRQEDTEQVCRYAADAQDLLPDFNIRKFVIYVVANKGYRIWEV